MTDTPRATPDHALLSTIRLVALDLDGTLLDAGYAIPPANAEAVRDLLAAGIRVVLATGRRFAIGAPYGEALGLPGPMIFQNGAVVKSLADRRLLFWQGLPPPLARRMVARGREAGFLPVLICDPHGPGRLEIEDSPRYYRHLERYLTRGRGEVRLVRRLEEAIPPDVLQLMFCGGVAGIRRLEGQLRSAFGEGAALLLTEYPARDLSLLDVMHRDVSKGGALTRLAGRLGIPMAGTLAVGDNFNDRQMLAAAGAAMVMGNADESLRRDFPLVLPSNEAGGVAWGVWRYVLDRPDRLARWFGPQHESM